MKENKIKEQFIEFRAQGWSYDRIAKELKVSKQTLIDWARWLRDDISNLKAIELDVMREKYRLHTQARLESFGQVLGRIQKELDARDLSTVPTEKLIFLFLRVNEALSHECTSLTFKGKQTQVDDLMDSVINATDVTWPAE